MQVERRRRAATAQALVAIVRCHRGSKVTVDAIRRHLAEYYGRALGKACTWDEMWRAVRACRGKVSWGVVGGRRQRHFRGVKLIPAVGFHRLQRSVDRRLLAEGLPEEVPLIRRPDDRVLVGGVGGKADSTIDLCQSGLMFQSEGIWKQTLDRTLLFLTADTKNADGKRGRVRRFVPYLSQLQTYLDSARIAAEDRQVLDLVVAGYTVRSIAAELGLSRWKVQSTIERHQVAAGISGPGPGC